MSRVSKPLLIFLTLSVLVNIYLVGLHFGKGFRPEETRTIRVSPSHEFSMRSIQRHLSEEEKDAFRKALRAKRKELKSRFEAVGDSYEDIHAVMIAPEFDRAALVEALKGREAALRTIHDPAREIILDLFEKIDQPTRAAIAADLLSRDRESRRDKKDGKECRSFDDAPPPPPGE
ncbi:hypothetical protein GCM10017044_07450 [Kordiimonas sediminis]|uniref:Periplasmic heavy metal sensor n=1 Tax=Kordiimonas sediminis TaxID=1735581 RepID=A0A919ALK4_9PROT|nr:periplasmic heavy metal sensor [Kordiimonas sediminis]GHF15757.1 hypothetical protein GCM10017044_07450 [Kordiimonas sediminis]